MDKYKLIHRDTREIMTYGDDNTVVFGGEWGQLDEEGNPIYIWVENDITPTPEQLQKMLTDAVQHHLDKKAQERGYDTILSASDYTGDDDPIFAVEGLACKRWKSKVWRTCYNILGEVMTGAREIPSVEELLAELPELVWPEVE